MKWIWIVHRRSIRTCFAIRIFVILLRSIETLWMKKVHIYLFGQKKKLWLIGLQSPLHAITIIIIINDSIVYTEKCMHMYIFRYTYFLFPTTNQFVIVNCNEFSFFIFIELKPNFSVIFRKGKTINSHEWNQYKSNWIGTCKLFSSLRRNIELLL